MEPHAGSPEFEQMKSLVGTWEGLMPMDKGGEIMKMVVKYRLTAWGWCHPQSDQCRRTTRH
jgi:hypothetical protein